MKIFRRVTWLFGSRRLAALCLALSVPAAAQTATGNLLQNPGFEESGRELDIPSSWISYVPYLSATLGTTREFAHTGTKSCTVQTTSDMSAFLVSDAPLPVAPGEEIEISVWCRAEDLASSSGGALMLSAGFLDDRARYFEWARFPVTPPAPGEWFPLREKVMVPPRACAMTLQMGLKNMTGRSWWDDATVVASGGRVVRFASAESPLLPGKSTVPLVLINRDPQSAGAEAVIRTEPGSHSTTVRMTADPLTTLSVPVTISKRDRINLKAVLDERTEGASDFSTSTTVIVPPLMTLEPPSPTHYVLEDGGTPHLVGRVELAERPEGLLKLSLRCKLRETSGSILTEWQSPAGLGRVVDFKLSLPPGKAERRGDYELEVELFRNGERVAAETTDWHVITRAEAKVVLGPDGNLLVDGKPFYPIGLYMGTNFPELAAAGFNVVQSYNAFAGPKSSNSTAKAFLDRAHAAGLKALVFVSHGPDRLNDEESLRRIRMFRNHPAMLLWYQEEAVDRGYKPLSYLENLYNTLKREGPHHPIMQGDRRDVAAKLVGRSDFFPDAYMDLGIWWWYPTPLRLVPHPDSFEGEVTGPELEYRPPPFLIKSNTKKPLWVALQSYRKPDQLDGRFPTPEEYRAQAYIAVCHGARGLIYYTGVGERGHGVQNRPEEGHWEELKKVVGELKEMSPVFLAPTAAEAPKLLPTTALVSTCLKEIGGRRVLIAVNRCAQPQSVTFELPGGSEGEARVRWENRAARVEAGGRLQDTFAPYAVHVYDLP